MSGRHKFSDLEAAMPPQRRARIERMTQTLSERIDEDEALRGAILSLLRRHPRGLNRRGVVHELEVSQRPFIDRNLAVLVENHLVTVHLSGEPLEEVYRCVVTTTAEDKLTAAGK